MDKKQVLLSIPCGFLKGGEGQHGVWPNPSLPEYPHLALFVSGDLSKSVLHLRMLMHVSWAKLQVELVPERSRVRLCPVPRAMHGPSHPL